MFGKGIHTIRKHQSSSTNAEIKTMLKKHETTVLIAEEQTAGVGRLGRSFFSPPGGIYMSIAHPLHNNMSNFSLYTPAAAVAVTRGIKKICKLDCGIKWVNDIFLGDKKVCGILCELYDDHIICGIGINFAGSAEKLPEEIEKTAGFLFEKDNRRMRLALESDIISRVMGFFASFPDIGFLDEYRKRSIIIGTTITISEIHGQYDALAISIDDRGRLVVSDVNGEIKTLNSGEVSIKAR